jgi:drug/metabolite transporter (DMT)-like permease
LKSWKAELLLFLVTFIWGGTFMFTKIGLNDANPALYIFIRFSIALIISSIILWKHILKIDKLIFKQGIILGLFFGGGFLLQTYGLNYTNVSKSAFITGITVPITPFIYWLVVRKPIKVWSKVGVVVATIGLWVFTKPDINDINIGDVMTLFSTFFWALYITYMEKFTKDRRTFSESGQLVILQFIGATPLSLIAVFVFEGANFNVNWTSSLITSLAFNSIMASILVTFIHTSIQKYTTPVKAALIFSLEPVVASFVAFMFINEILNGRELIGGAILLFGVLISEIGGIVFRKASKQPK